MVIITSLFLILSLSLVTLDSVPEEECGGPLSAIYFDEIEDACAYYARCTQPTNKLNAECILSSCPSLSGVCPINPNGSVNNHALNTAVSGLNTCIGQEGLICGINMSHTPVVKLGWTTKNILPTNVVNGSIQLSPEGGFLDNLSSANFTILQTGNPKGPISLSIQAPYVTMKSHLTCTFNLTEGAFLQEWKRQLTTDSPNSVIIPDMLCTYTNYISCMVSIDLTSTITPIIDIFDDQSYIAIVYSNFIDSNRWALPQSLVNAFNRGMQGFVKNSDMVSTASNFLATFAAQGLQAAQLDCP